ncbi:16005_t:CDS:2 [Acaulospora morrowiae]|uniref:16005_t:CDS:1 n=1 Tax=Acaulospora morrowiae TaxID=94023 RepID=A0A9N8V5N2_9GLOM|nr:16005_t:CDS:2 [Acaulospora morrowiae]
MEPSEEIQTVENPEIINKYQMVAEVSNQVRSTHFSAPYSMFHLLEDIKGVVISQNLCVLRKLIESAVDGASILDLCTLGDKLIEEGVKVLYAKNKNISKGIAFPTCVSVNHIICHFSPLPSDQEGSETLKNGDLAKIELGAQIDGYAAIVATTIVVGASKENPVKGRLADVLTAAYLASEAAMRLTKPGLNNMEVTETIQKIAKSYETNPVEGMLSYQQNRNDIEGDKQIILNPSDQQKREFQSVTFEENEVYGIDILVSTGEGKPKPSSARTTVYRKTNKTYSLKIKTSRAVFAEISQKFGSFPFPLRALGDEKKARMGIVECSKHGLVTPYDVYQEKEGEFVAQFFNTILLTKNGTIKITNIPFDPEIVQSDKKIEDEKILELLSTNIRPTKKKNKKKQAGDKDSEEKGKDTAVVAENAKE